MSAAFASEELGNGKHYRIDCSAGGIKYRALDRFADQTISDVTLGQDEYFVLGDTIGNARDSRFFGAVPRQDIIGKAIRIEPGGP